MPCDIDSSCGHKNYDYVSEGADKKGIKGTQIFFSNTFSHPWTMMIEPLNTNVTISTMFCIPVFHDITDMAKSKCLSI